MKLCYDEQPIHRSTSLMYMVKEQGKWSKPKLFHLGNNHYIYPTLEKESP